MWARRFFSLVSRAGTGGEARAPNLLFGKVEWWKRSGGFPVDLGPGLPFDYAEATETLLIRGAG